MIKNNISVIVPIYNAEKYLENLFDSFDKNDFIEGDEILLIDNNSDDNSKKMCIQKANSMPNLYKFFEYKDKPDSYATRNYGVNYSSGEILVFTDSDCKPVAGWISEIRKNLHKGEILAGDVKLEVVDNSVWECFDSITHLSQSKEHIKNNCVATANMAVYKEDFNNVGKFEERFAGGDFEWSNRAVNEGMKVVFCDDALILHPSRKTYEEILIREKRGAYGAGKSTRNNKQSVVILILKYFLKIFKFDTYFRITHSMKEYNISLSERVKFMFMFFLIRCKQLKSSIDGYIGVDARKMGIK